MDTLGHVPFYIGLAYFILLDLSFSCWFFYIFRKGLQILGTAGWEAAIARGYPYFNEQASGAWLAAAFIALWASRGHLRSIFQTTLKHQPTLDDSQEPMRYRSASIGSIAGMIFLTFLCPQTGMSYWAIILLFVIYFLLAIAMTRVRAELGTPHEILFVNPQQIMVAHLRHKCLRTH